MKLTLRVETSSETSKRVSVEIDSTMGAILGDTEDVGGLSLGGNLQKNKQEFHLVPFFFLLARGIEEGLSLVEISQIAHRRSLEHTVTVSRGAKCKIEGPFATNC